MSRIVRPDLVTFMGEAYEDTEQLVRRIRQNEVMGLTLLRRRSFFEGFYALAKEDEENAAYWEEIATECKRLYEYVWSGETEEATAWKKLLEVLQRPMPEKPPTLEELRERMASSLQGKGMNGILRRIKEALVADEWKRLFEEDAEAEEAYGKLKSIYFEKCTERFLELLDDKYQTYMKHHMIGGGAKEVSRYVLTWCLDAAAKNLEGNTNGYLQDEKLWTEQYETERKELLGSSRFYVAAGLLECWDEIMKQEPGSTLKNSLGYEKCKPGLECEEKKFAVLEEAYSRLKVCRAKLVDGSWFELWENSETKGVERTALFLLAAGKVNEDPTDFDRILRAESDIKYSDTECAELGRWYWNQGRELAKEVSRTKSRGCKCEVGDLQIPEAAAEAVRYILNELSKWRKPDEKTTEIIKKCAYGKTVEENVIRKKKQLECCEADLKKRQKETDELFRVQGPWSRMYQKNRVMLCLDKKKEQYYLVKCISPYSDGILAEKCYELMESVVLKHRYRKWYRLFSKVTFGPNKKKQQGYVRLYNFMGEIGRAKKACECFVEERNRLLKKMRTECTKMKEQEVSLLAITSEKYAKAQNEGLFSFRENQWNALIRRYEEFFRMKREWEEMASSHWEKEYRVFQRQCEIYEVMMSKVYEDCYCLLTLKKREKGEKKRWSFIKKMKENMQKLVQGRKSRHAKKGKKK